MRANEQATGPYDRHVGHYGAELADGLIEFADIEADRRDMSLAELVVG